MTRTYLIKRVGWTLAMLGVFALSIQAQAKASPNARNNQRGQNSRQVERQRSSQPQRGAAARQDNSRRERADQPQRGAAQREEQRKQERAAEQQRQAQRDAQRAAQQREAQQRERQAQQRRQQQAAEQQRQTQREAQQRERQEQQRREERAGEQRRQDRIAAEQRESAAQQRHQRAQQDERNAREQNVVLVDTSASTERGANWGVNAQKRKLDERQAELRLKAQRLEQKRLDQRQDLREAKQRFENKVQVEKQQLRQRDQRLDARAQDLRYRENHPRTVTRVITRSPSYYRPGYSRYGHGAYRYDDCDDDHSYFGISLNFGDCDSASFYYSSGFYSNYRCNCYSSGYWTREWVPAVYVTRYDRYGCPYQVLICEGYYKRVWVAPYCRLGRHQYYTPYALCD